MTKRTYTCYITSFLNWVVYCTFIIYSSAETISILNHSSFAPHQVSPEDFVIPPAYTCGTAYSTSTNTAAFAH
jgi:hypothetical protein